MAQLTEHPGLLDLTCDTDGPTADNGEDQFVDVGRDPLAIGAPDAGPLALELISTDNSWNATAIGLSLEVWHFVS
jgi:hypothetical protein